MFADPCRNLLRLGCAPHWLGFEHGALGDQTLKREHFHGLNDGGNERFVIGARIKAATAVQSQDLVQCGLQGVVARFDGYVLVGLAGVAVCCTQPVVAAQVCIPLLQFLLFSQVVESRRQAVGTVLFGHYMQVRLVISCSDSLSRTKIRLILFNISMVINLFVFCLKFR